MKIVPFGGAHQNWRSLLGEIMEQEEIEQLVIVTYDKDGTPGFGHHKMTKERLAHAALFIQTKAMSKDPGE